MSIKRQTALILFFALLTSGLAAAATQNEIPAVALMQPAQLNSQMKDVRSGKIVLIYVGFRVMYEMARIPGSTFVGTASTPEGLEDLRKYAAKFPRSQQIVIYCGCCPWSHCPNIRPAYQTLHDMGFSRLKAVYMPERLGDDWTAKGYPIER